MGLLFAGLVCQGRLQGEREKDQSGLDQQGTAAGGQPAVQVF